MIDIFFRYKHNQKFVYKIFEDYLSLIGFLDDNYSDIKVYYIYDYTKHDFIFNFSDF